MCDKVNEKSDPISKAVRRRCRQVAEYIERNESSEQSSYHSGTEQTVSDEEDVEQMQGMLEELESRETKQDKTFSEERLRDIERRNAILMDKILRHSRRQNQYKSTAVPNKVASAAINRRRQQEKINRDNLVAIWFLS